MKTLFIALALVAVIAGGSVGALYFLEMGPFEKTEGPEEEEIPLPEDIETVDIRKFTVPIFQGNKVVANVQIQFRVESPKDKKHIIENRLPRLEDAYQRDLYTYLPRVMRNGEPVDIPKLKARLLAITQRLVGPEAATDILIQSVSDRAG